MSTLIIRHRLGLLVGVLVVAVVLAVLQQQKSLHVYEQCTLLLALLTLGLFVAVLVERNAKHPTTCRSGTAASPYRRMPVLSW